MAFTASEKKALSVAYTNLRLKAESAGQVDFDGNFFDLTPAQQKATLLPEVSSLLTVAQAELAGFIANQGVLTTRVTVLNGLIIKLA